MGNIELEEEVVLEDIDLDVVYLGEMTTDHSKLENLSYEDSNHTGFQKEITNEEKLSSDLVDDASATNKFVTSEDIISWNSKIDKNVDDLTYYYTKTEVDGKVSSVYRYRGTVATYADLPSSDLTVGDVYNVETDGSNYAWNGTVWDKLGGDIDLSGYQTKIDSTHKLSSDLVDDTNNTNKFVTSTEKTTWSNKYDKPLTGIPSTDMSSAVQTSLGKADTAEQVINKVTSLSSSSTDTEYPSAKAVYDALLSAGGDSVTYINSDTLVLAGKKKGIYVLNNENKASKGVQIQLYNSGGGGASTTHAIPIVYILKDIPEENISSTTLSGVFAKLIVGNGGLNCMEFFMSGTSITYNYVVIDDSYLTTSGIQTITAKKTFSTLPESSVTPTTDNHLVNKKYVDELNFVKTLKISNKRDISTFSKGLYMLSFSDNGYLYYMHLPHGGGEAGEVRITNFTSEVGVAFLLVVEDFANLDEGDIFCYYLNDKGDISVLLYELSSLQEYEMGTNAVNTNSVQTIGAKKIFTVLPESSITPTTANQLTNKTYVDTKQNIMQYSTMPTASAETVGKIVQFIGTTTNDYTNGYFYIGTSTTESDITTYSWENINVQPGGSDLPSNFGFYKISDYYSNSAISWASLRNAVQADGYGILYFDSAATISTSTKSVNVTKGTTAFVSTSGSNYVYISFIKEGTSYLIRGWYLFSWSTNIYDSNSNFASYYSSSSTYNEGDCVIYNDKLYKCNTTISGAEPWTAAHWTATTVATELNRASAFDPTTVSGYDATANQTLSNEEGTLTWQDGTIYELNTEVVQRLSALTSLQISNIAVVSELPQTEEQGTMYFVED